MGDLQAILTQTDERGYLGTLDGYKVIEIIGSGGMGTVLRAYDPRLRRTVAIKVLSPMQGDETARRRFLREAQAAARIKDDHIVTIYSINEDYRPPFIVMEYVEGSSLQQIISDGKGFQTAEIIRLGKQIAKGLAAAHALGQVHRDIKPANILIEDKTQRAKIADFGIATIPGSDQLTHTGQILGTPRYMSPEQARGDVVGTSSDIFSLGIILYELCTGRSPFQADSSMATLRRICEDRPIPVHEITDEVPRWLSELVDLLLSKDPKSRPNSAEELARLLDNPEKCGSASGQSLASTVDLAPELNRSIDRKPRLKQLIAVSAAILTLIALLVGNYGKNDPAPCEGAIKYVGNGHWFLPVEVENPEGFSWSEANAYARSLGGHLATITDEGEEAFVVRLINSTD